MTKGATETVEVLVIGGGYYGCQIALHLSRKTIGRVVLAEKSRRLMVRASFVNQARVHGGYHYPRAIDTANAARRYFARFLREHETAIVWETQSIYAIASSSKVSPVQFEQVCGEIGAPLKPVSREISALFDRNLIEAAYFAEEYSFDASKIAKAVTRELADSDVDLRFSSTAKILSHDGEATIVEVGDKRIRAKTVFNCTYCNLEGVGASVRTPLRHETAEIALIHPPADIAGLAVTVMDGPFFSTMPFPAMDAYSLTHVRFTPMTYWESGEFPSEGERSGYSDSINADAMIRDASRYLPSLRNVQPIGSLFDTKSVMMARESDDGRPILYEESRDHPGVISILGSKMDNIYDVLNLLDQRYGETASYA